MNPVLLHDMVHGDPAAEIVIQSEQVIQTERKFCRCGEVRLIVASADGGGEKDALLGELELLHFAVFGGQAQFQFVGLSLQKLPHI